MGDLINNSDLKNLGMEGNPSEFGIYLSLIKSNKKDNIFDGKAEKIIFFNDQKVHLIGNASMKYENISISSNLIVFNPQTGKISSD